MENSGAGHKTDLKTVPGRPMTVIVVFPVHEKEWIEATNCVQAVAGDEPGSCIHKCGRIHLFLSAKVQIRQEPQLSLRQKRRKASIEMSALAVEMKRAQNPKTGMRHRSLYKLGNGFWLNAGVLIQQKHPPGLPAERFANANVVGLSKAQIALLWQANHIRKGRDEG